VVLPCTAAVVSTQMPFCVTFLCKAALQSLPGSHLLLRHCVHTWFLIPNDAVWCRFPAQLLCEAYLTAISYSAAQRKGPRATRSVYKNLCAHRYAHHVVQLNHTYTHMYTHTCARTHAYTHTGTHAHPHKRKHTHMRTNTQTSACAHTHIHTYTHTHLHKHTRVHTISNNFVSHPGTLQPPPLPPPTLGGTTKPLMTWQARF